MNYYLIPDIIKKLTKIMEDTVTGEKSRIELGYLGFANLVRGGKKYDLKAKDEWKQNRHYLFNREVIDWDEPGNIFYGYFGYGIGFQNMSY